MNTYIISARNLKKGKVEAEKIIEAENVDKFEQILDIFEKDLGIEDVRNIKKKIYVKPLRGNRKSNILILKKGASREAQNAMLKLLEEPPASSIIIIITQNYHIFLPTILSRVKVIEVKNEKKLNNEGLIQILEIKNAGDSLYLAEVISKDRDKAILWLEDAIFSARDEMINNLDDNSQSLKYHKIIKDLELAHSDLKNTNVNARLALENLFLNFS